MPLFEFDPAKSAKNLAKHGIDFTQAQALWSDHERLEIDANTTEETRHQIIGRIGDTIWSAIVTYRRGATRLISVRRARRNELARYRGRRV